MAYHLRQGARGFEPNDVRGSLWGDVVLGVGLAGLGVVVTLGDLGVIDGSRLTLLWPGLLVVVGVSCLLGPSAGRKLTCGLLWIAVGAVMLLGNLGMVAVGLDALWPMILIVLGIDLVVCRARARHTEVEYELDRGSRHAV